MVRAPAVLVALAAAVIAGGGCGPKGDGIRPWPTVVADEPAPVAGPPAAHETCYRERFVVRGHEIEMRLRILVEPAAGTITRRVTERGPNGPGRWTTVMTVTGDRFTSIEDGEDGPATGAGTLLGPAGAPTGWRSVTQRAEGFADHDTATVVADGLIIATESRGPDGAVSSTGLHHYLTAACATLDDEPITKLEPAAPSP